MSEVITYANNRYQCFCQIKLASRERVLISIASAPTPSVKIVKLGLLGLWSVQTIWEYNPIMAGGYEAYIRKIADYVEKKVQEILDYSKAIASFNAAILAALNIADDYHHLKETQETLVGKILELSQRVSTTLGEDPSSESMRGSALGKLPVEGVRETSIEEEKTEVL